MLIPRNNQTQGNEKNDASVPESSHSDTKITIFIAEQDGQTHKYTADFTDSIKQIKQKVLLSLGWTLIYMNRPLDDDSTLPEYGIKHLSTLTAIKNTSFGKLITKPDIGK